LSFELLKRTLSDKNSMVRQAVVYALLSIGNEKTYDALIHALKDKNRDVRYPAINALIELEDDRVVNPLIHVLKCDKDSIIRATAAIGLLRCRDPGSIETLISALTDKYSQVRYNAHIALINMTGMTIDADPQKWRSWWKENKHEY
jgi:HEAT repeat protein